MSTRARTIFFTLPFWMAALVGCEASAPVIVPPVAGKPTPAASTPPVEVPAKPRETPPPPGAPVDVHLPAATWTEQPDGLTIGMLPIAGLPLAEVRVVVMGGRAAEGEQRGASEILAEIVKRSAAGVESLGGRLDVQAGDDAVTLRLGVPAEELSAALEAVAKAMSAPRFEAKDVETIRKRLAGEASDLMREDGDEAASRMMRRALFTGPAGLHPYGRSGAMAEELEKLGVADVKAFHQRTFTPANTFVLVAGAIDVAVMAKSNVLAKAFAKYRGRAARATVPAVVAPSARRLVLVHIPKAERSQVLVGFLGPRATEPEYAAFAVLDRLLGTKGTGRLFNDVREARSLAYVTRTFTTEFAGGPQELFAYADTQTAKTGQTVAAVLENLERAGKEAPSEDEINVARQATRAALSAKLRTMADIADVVADQKRLGLPAAFMDQHQRAIDATTPASVRAAAAQFLVTGRAIVVVAGDADQIGSVLAEFGAVEVVDASKGFATVRKIEAKGKP